MRLGVRHKAHMNPRLLKLALAVLLVISPVLAFGQVCVPTLTQPCTPNVSLALPNVNSPDWNVLLNQNFNWIDALLGGTSSGIALSLSDVSAIDGTLMVDASTWGLSAAGIQAALDHLTAVGNGCGTVVLPPTNSPIVMGSTGITVRSCQTLKGAGLGSTILQWTGTTNAIALTSPVRATVSDMTLQFTAAAANSSAIRITASDAAPALFNSFENLLLDYPCTGGICGFGGTPGLSTNGAGFFITTSGPSNTDYVLNTARNIYVSAADLAVDCQGCEGNYWQVTAQYMGGTSGHSIFAWTGLEADEQGDLRAETGTGNPSTLSCLSLSGSTNVFRLTCDGGGSTVTAIGSDPGWNNFDIVTAGPVTLGTPSINSKYQFSSSSIGVNTTGVAKLLVNVGVSPDGPGFKHKRGVSGCTTAASVGATCTTTLTWTTPFVDTNYSVYCQGHGVTSGVPMGGGITAKVAASATFQTVAATAAAAQYTAIDCFGSHD